MANIKYQLYNCWQIDKIAVETAIRNQTTSNLNSLQYYQDIIRSVDSSRKFEGSDSTFLRPLIEAVYEQATRAKEGKFQYNNVGQQDIVKDPVVFMQTMIRKCVENLFDDVLSNAVCQYVSEPNIVKEFLATLDDPKLSDLLAITHRFSQSMMYNIQQNILKLQEEPLDKQNMSSQVKHICVAVQQYADRCLSSHLVLKTKGAVFKEIRECIKETYDLLLRNLQFANYIQALRVIETMASIVNQNLFKLSPEQAFHLFMIGLEFNQDQQEEIKGISDTLHALLTFHTGFQDSKAAMLDKFLSDDCFEQFIKRFQNNIIPGCLEALLKYKATMMSLKQITQYEKMKYSQIGILNVLKTIAEERKVLDDYDVIALERNQFKQHLINSIHFQWHSQVEWDRLQKNITYLFQHPNDDLFIDTVKYRLVPAACDLNIHAKMNIYRGKFQISALDAQDTLAQLKEEADEYNQQITARIDVSEEWKQKHIKKIPKGVPAGIIKPLEIRHAIEHLILNFAKTDPRQAFLYRLNKSLTIQPLAFTDTGNPYQDISEYKQQYSEYVDFIIQKCIEHKQPQMVLRDEKPTDAELLRAKIRQGQEGILGKGKISIDNITNPIFAQNMFAQMRDTPEQRKILHQRAQEVAEIQQRTNEIRHQNVKSSQEYEELLIKYQKLTEVAGLQKENIVQLGRFIADQKQIKSQYVKSLQTAELQFQTVMADQTNKLDAIQKIKQEIDQLLLSNTSSDPQIQELEQELSDLKSEIADLKEKESSIIRDATATMKRLEELKTQEGELKKQQQDAAAEHKRILSKITAYEQEILEFKKTKNLQEEQIERVRQTGDVTKELQDTDLRIQALRREVQLLTQEVGDHKLKIGQLEQERQQLEQISKIIENTKLQEALLLSKDQLDQQNNERAELEQKIRELNTHLTEAAIPNVNFNQPRDKVINDLEQRQKEVVNQINQQEKRINDTEDLQRALLSSEESKINDLLLQLAQVKRRYSDVDNAKLLETLNKLREDCLSAMASVISEDDANSKEQLKLLREMNISTYNDWMQLFFKSRDLMEALNKKLSENLDQSTQLQRTLEAVQQVKDQIALLDQSIKDNRSKYVGVQKDIQQIELKHRDLFERFKLNPNDENLILNIQQQKDILRNQLKDHNDQLDELLGQKKKLEQAMNTLADLRKLMQEVDSIVAADIEAAERTSVKTAEEQLQLALAKFKDEFDDKFKLIPPQLRDVSHDVNKLQEVLDNVQSALYLAKIRRLKEIEARLMQANAVIDKNHEYLDANVGLESQETIQEHIVQVIDLLVQQDPENKDIQALAEQLKQVKADDQGIRDVSQRIDALIRKRLQKLTNNIKNLGSRVAIQEKQVASIFEFISMKTAQVKQDISRMIANPQLKHQLETHLEDVNQFMITIQNPIKDGQIGQLFADFHSIINLILEKMSQFNVADDIKKYSNEFSKIMEFYLEQVEKYRNERDIVSSRYQELAKLSQDYKKLTEVNLRKFKDSVTEIQETLQLKNILNSTKLWMDSIQLDKSIIMKTNSEFHHLVDINEVMLIVYNDRKQQIQVNNIPFPSDPMKIFTHNYSKDYRDAILKKLIQAIPNKNDEQLTIMQYIRNPTIQTKQGLDQVLMIPGNRTKMVHIQQETFYSTIIDYIHETYPHWVTKPIGEKGYTLGQIAPIQADGSYKLKYGINSSDFQSVIQPLCKNLWLIGLVFNIYYQFDIEWKIIDKQYVIMQSQLEDILHQINTMIMDKEKRDRIIATLNKINALITDYQAQAAEQVTFIIQMFILPAEPTTEQSKARRKQTIQEIGQRVEDLIYAPTQRAAQNAFKRLFPSALSSQDQLDAYQRLNQLSYLDTNPNKTLPITKPIHETLATEWGSKAAGPETIRIVEQEEQKIQNILDKKSPMKGAIQELQQRPEQQIRQLLSELPLNIDISPYIAGNLFEPKVEKVRTIDNSIRQIFKHGLAPVARQSQMFNYIRQMLQECLDELEQQRLEQEQQIVQGKQIMQQRPQTTYSRNFNSQQQM